MFVGKHFNKNHLYTVKMFAVKHRIKLFHVKQFVKNKLNGLEYVCRQTL